MKDFTAINMETDPEKRRISGIARHGNTPFDCPYITKIGTNLYQGGCTEGLILPKNIEHVVSLYPWERYDTQGRILLSELYVQMFDSEDQTYTQLELLSSWINQCRATGDVLVHCQAGLNRSSLVAARALFKLDRMSGDEIIDRLRELRSPAVLCNYAFEAEVRSWS